MAQTKTNNPIKDLIAGGTAGAIEAAMMYPTEFVKTQMQLAEKGGVKYRNPIQCAQTFVREKGPLSLYRGMSTLLIGSIPKAAVRFAAYKQFEDLLKDKTTGKVSAQGTMLAGLGAGVCEAIVAVTPMETVKTMMINDQNSKNPRYKGLVHGVRLMIAEEGIRGIYKGIVPTMMKQGTNQMVRFSIFNQIKALITGGDSKAKLALWQQLAGGSVAGFVSVYATMPFDVVKTRMQSLDAKMYSGTWGCFTHILKNEGVLALWHGTTPRLGRVCFSGAIIFAAYEQILAGLNIFWPEK